MREDDLRDQLNDIADRLPAGPQNARAEVLHRGRRLVARRRAAWAGTALATVVVLGGGVALWRADNGSQPRTIVTTVPTISVHPTTVAPTTIAPTTAPRTTIVPTVPPTAGAATTTTTLPASTRVVVPADPGYTFTSSPVVTGGAAFAIETELHGATAVDARVVRVDLGTRRIVATADQPGAAAIVPAGNRIWVGVGSGSGGPFGAPPITRAVALDPRTLAAIGSVTLPAPGSEGLATSNGAVWALSGSNAVRIDATTVRIAATVTLALPASNPNRTLAVSADGSELYVGWATARQIEGVSEFDATTAQLLHQNANVGSGPSNVGPELTDAGAQVWATFPTGSLGSAVALSASDLHATGPVIDGPNSMAITPSGVDMWVSRDATLDCVGLGDATLASHPLAGGVTTSVAVVPGTVYATTGTGFVVITAGACGS